MHDTFILASASPRRRQLLQQAGRKFVVCPAEVDEKILPAETALSYVHRVTRAKALALDAGQVAACVKRSHDDGKLLDQRPLILGPLILAADTIVHLDAELLGKPADAAQALQTLQKLSGREHAVTTCFALCRDGQILRAEDVTTRVRFRPLSEREIADYIDSGEPFDKAGAYGIQGLGGFLVDAVQGSYTNVVGLPLTQVLAGLDDFAAGSGSDEYEGEGHDGQS